MIAAPEFVGTLSAMITPVVVIAACSSLVMATTQRVSRTIARARELGIDYRKLARGEVSDPITGEELRTIFDQLEASTRRVGLLQHATVALYAALGMFILVSIAIGAQVALHHTVRGLVTSLGFAGALLLLYASATLMREALLTRRAMRDEMDFLCRVRATLAPAELRREGSEGP